MAVFGAESPLQLTGDLQRDIETIRNYIYERDMELRHVLSHLDESNFVEGVLEQPDPVTNITNEGSSLDLTKATGILPVGKGGTGAADVTAALQNLGIMAKVGDVLDMNLTLVYHGFLSNSQKTVTIDVPLPKILPNGATVTIESLKVNMRKPAGGYIGASDSYVEGGMEYVGNANYTVVPGSIMPRRIAIQLTNSASTFNSDNNVPVSIEGTVRLKVI